MSEQKHTPTPWKSDGRYVYALDETGTVNRFSVIVQGGYIKPGPGHYTPLPELEANAAFIARAVNSYDTHRALIAELVEALGRAAGYLRDLEANMLANDLDMRLDIRVPPSVIAEDVEVAIAKAKSESAP